MYVHSMLLWWGVTKWWQRWYVVLLRCLMLFAAAVVVLCVRTLLTLPALMLCQTFASCKVHAPQQHHQQQ